MNILKCSHCNGLADILYNDVCEECVEEVFEADTCVLDLSKEEIEVMPDEAHSVE